MRLLPPHWLAAVAASVLLGVDIAAEPARPEENNIFSIPLVDFASEKERQIVIDRAPGVYLGQPDTVLLQDGTTIVLAYPLNHGGRGDLPNGCVVRRSLDGGRTWSDRLLTPENFARAETAPTIHRIPLGPGKGERLVIFIGQWPMQRALSEDGGQTWTPFEPVVGMTGGTTPPKSLVQISGNRWLGAYQDWWIEGKPPGIRGKEIWRRSQKKELKVEIEVVKIVSDDNGITWSGPVRFGNKNPFADSWPTEPEIIRSSDGRQLLCILRENSRKYSSLICISNDEGETWGELKELPPELTGDRHIAQYTPDGRLVIAFRDMAKKSGTYGDYVAWVGTDTDLLKGSAGQYRIRLLKNHGKPADTGYGGLEYLPDGTMVGTTYCPMAPDEPPSIVSVRFKLSESDGRARQLAENAARHEQHSKKPQ